MLTLEQAQDEYSCPAVIQVKDSKVHITYQRQSVNHSVIDSEKF